jgi:hypothetical protein
MTGAHLHTQLYIALRWRLVNFLPSWLGTTVLLISASSAVKIVSISHSAWLKIHLLIEKEAHYL